MYLLIFLTGLDPHLQTNLLLLIPNMGCITGWPDEIRTKPGLLTLGFPLSVVTGMQISLCGSLAIVKAPAFH